MRAIIDEMDARYCHHDRRWRGPENHKEPFARPVRSFEVWDGTIYYAHLYNRRVDGSREDFPYLELYERDDDESSLLLCLYGDEIQHVARLLQAASRELKPDDAPLITNY